MTAGSAGSAGSARYAAAVSEHPLATQAIGEVVGSVLERIGPNPELAVLFVTPPHLGALDDVARVVREVLRPVCLLGAASIAVIGPGREVEETAGVSLFAARLSAAPTPVRLRAALGPDGWELDGLDDVSTSARSLLLVADPFTFRVDALLDVLSARRPQVAVIGGLASAAGAAGGNRLLVDDDVVVDGAIGALLDEAVAPETIVSQGCRPIGQPFIVTRSEQNILYELGGRPALERLLATVNELSPEDRQLASRGLHCGMVIDERKAEFGRGDFLIRAVLGADKEVGAVAVGDSVQVGATVQFQVRDADSAHEDLQELLSGRSAGGALVFSCNGRGRRLFGTPDHDATVVGDLLGTPEIAGMFCAGELGPVGGHNAVHGFTASVALFR